MFIINACTWRINLIRLIIKKKWECLEIVKFQGSQIVYTYTHYLQTLQKNLIEKKKYYKVQHTFE